MAVDDVAPSSSPARTQLPWVAAYVALATYPLIAAAAGSAFWDSATAPAASVVFAVLVAAFIARRRWAWWTLLFVESLTLVTIVVAGDTLGIVIQIARVGLLLSPPVRWYFAGRATSRAPVSEVALQRRSLLPGPASKPSLAGALVLLLIGALLTPFSIAAVVLGGATALLGCALPGLVALTVGVRELNRWTRTG